MAVVCWGVLHCLSDWNPDAVTCLCALHTGRPPGTADRAEGAWAPTPRSCHISPGPLTSTSAHRTAYMSPLSKPLLTGALITAAEPLSWLIPFLPLVGSHWRTCSAKSSKEVPGAWLRAGTGVSSAAGGGQSRTLQGNAGTNNHPAGKTGLRSMLYAARGWGRLSWCSGEWEMRR